MTPSRSDQGFVRMPDAEFEAILTRAAEKGAKRALADVGLDGEDAALDVHGLRTLSTAFASSAAPRPDRWEHDHHSVHARAARRPCHQAEDVCDGSLICVHHE